MLIITSTRMTYKSHTTSSINFEGLQMKLKRPIKKTLPNMVSIFMASQCGIFLKDIINLFSYI